jgi:uncharacterized SAM-binding protein YcdF (DUF218 family)
MTPTLLKVRGIQRVLLVASAMHMTRARPDFEAVGLDVFPATADRDRYTTAQWIWRQRWLHSSEALGCSALAFKERAGQRMM